VHVRVGLLTGRTTEAKQQLGEVVLEQAGHAIKPVPGLSVSVSVEIFDMDRETYQRITI
jgi:5-carboxymethyl-2-hydroxymuconate isomerase